MQDAVRLARRALDPYALPLSQLERGGSGTIRMDEVPAAAQSAPARPGGVWGPAGGSMTAVAAPPPSRPFASTQRMDQDQPRPLPLPPPPAMVPPQHQWNIVDPPTDATGAFRPGDMAARRSSSNNAIVVIAAVAAAGVLIGVALWAILRTSPAETTPPTPTATATEAPPASAAPTAPASVTAEPTPPTSAAPTASAAPATEPGRKTPPSKKEPTKAKSRPR
jgi:hypothetical protein